LQTLVNGILLPILQSKFLISNLFFVSKFVHRAKRLCKSFVELDRNMAATERNYISFLLAMNPCWTPKNDVIFGYPI